MGSAVGLKIRVNFGLLSCVYVLINVMSFAFSLPFSSLSCTIILKLFLSDLLLFFQVSVSSVVQLCQTLCETPWTAALQASLFITISQSLLKLMSVESVMPTNHLILCRPLLLLPPGPPSIRVFSNESALRMRWPQYWSYSLSISPSSEHPGVISFRMDWLDLLAVQGTLKSLLQHHSSKPSILWQSAFFQVYWNTTAICSLFSF